MPGLGYTDQNGDWQEMKDIFTCNYQTWGLGVDGKIHPATETLSIPSPFVAATIKDKGALVEDNTAELRFTKRETANGPVITLRTPSGLDLDFDWRVRAHMPSSLWPLAEESYDILLFPVTAGIGWATSFPLQLQLDAHPECFEGCRPFVMHEPLAFRSKPDHHSLHAALPDILTALDDLRDEVNEWHDRISAMIVDLKDEIAWVRSVAVDASAAEVATQIVGNEAATENTEHRYEGLTAEALALPAYNAAPLVRPEDIPGATPINGTLSLVPDKPFVVIAKGAPVYVETDDFSLVSVWARCEDDVLRDLTAAVAEICSSDSGGTVTLVLHECAPEPIGRCDYFTYHAVESTERGEDGHLHYRCTSENRVKIMHWKDEAE